MATAAPPASSDAALGRSAAAGYGGKAPAGLDEEAYGAHVRQAIGAGKPVQKPQEWMEGQQSSSATPSAPPRPAQRRAEPSARPSGGGRSPQLPSLGDGMASGGRFLASAGGQGVVGSAATKLIGMVVVGLVVLEVASLATGRQFNLTVPLRGAPAPAAPTPYLKPSL